MAEKPFILRVFLSHAVSYALAVAQQLDGIFGFWCIGGEVGEFNDNQENSP